MKAFRQLNLAILKGFKFIMIVFLSIMLVVLFAQVVARYVFDYGILWSEELARFMCIWIAMLGSAIACIDFSHIRVSFAEDMFKRAKPLLNLIQMLAILAFGVLLLKYGYDYLYARGAMAMASTLGISLRYLYVVFPISALVISLNTIYLILEWFTQKKWKNNFSEEREEL